MTVYGPPGTTLRLIVEPVAPAAPVHVSVTRPSPPTARRFCGGLGGATHERMALFTSRRPPVMVSGGSSGTPSTVLSSGFFSCAVFSAQRDRTSAAAPDTCGVAIDVPLNDE